MRKAGQSTLERASTGTWDLSASYLLIQLAGTKAQVNASWNVQISRERKEEVAALRHSGVCSNFQLPISSCSMSFVSMRPIWLFDRHGLNKCD